MSRLDIKSPSRAETVVENLYRDVERRIAASPPGLCPVDMALSFLRLCHAQSCGKCVPCRIGLGQLSLLLEQLLSGTATMNTLVTIEKTARTIVNTADCAIGRDAARLVVDGLEGFRDDYEEHILHQRCLAGLKYPVPCVALCPAGVDIPGYMALVGEDRCADAVRLIRKDNPFPVACAYICEHPCEARCRRNMIDDAINIRGLKRYAVDHAGEVPQPTCAPATGKRVAIVGGGPSGLSCAYYLALMGHKVTVFEEAKQLGGMLRYGIPNYRFPRHLLDAEIQSILSLGIEVHTGVTAIIPHTGDVFHEKCLAGAHVINGFGKSIGLVQVQELGTLETPILLTNTLSVGTVSTALVEYMLERNDDIGLDAGTVNSLVLECNDARLSDIRGLHITKEHARAALDAAADTFAEGDVGAGAGMVCYSLKGGIGSASRLCRLYGETYTVGALVMTNFGTLRDLKVAGDSVGERLFWQEQSELKDKGSIIVIIATDVPLSARQLERVAKRAQSGIARTGGISGNGSGEIALAFTTGNKLAHYSSDRLESIRLVYEEDIDEVFRAAIESVDEAIISSMLHAKAVTGRAGNHYKSLADLYMTEKKSEK